MHNNYCALVIIIYYPLYNMLTMHLYTKFNINISSGVSKERKFDPDDELKCTFKPLLSFKCIYAI